MQVTAPGSNAATQAAKASASGIAADYQAFLKLLVAQLKNQDPTKPMDSTQYLSQLASFSSVEQAIQTNARLDKMLNSSGLNDAQALLGRTVVSADGATTGRVVSATLASEGLTLTLDTGATVAAGNGLTVLAP